MLAVFKKTMYLKMNLIVDLKLLNILRVSLIYYWKYKIYNITQTE